MSSLTPAAPGSTRQRLRVEMSQARRAAASTSLKAFVSAYLPAHMTLPPSRMHAELFTELDAITARRGARLAIAAPRGHAKSTVVSLGYVLYCVCFGLEKYILLISNTAEQASDFLSHIRTELAENPRIAEDFPELVDPPGPSRWRRDEIITRTGIKITALGAEKKIRGRRNQQHRPGLIILDDIENEQDCRSPEQRRQRMDWLQRSVLKAGTGTTNLVAVGTVIHADGLLANLLDPAKSPGWATRIYRAVEEWTIHPELWETWEAIYCGREPWQGRSGPAAAQAFYTAHQALMLEGTRVLWPQREDYRRLMEVRLTEGRFSFDAEKQNNPVNPDECYFPASEFIFWDDQYADDQALLRAIHASGGSVQTYGACDPSLGRLGKNRDDTAIITIVRDSRTGILYVLDADIRRRKPDEILEAVIQLHSIRRYLRLGFETNQFQEFLASELERRSRERGVQVPVMRVQHSTDKAGRIQRLQPLVSAGALRFSRRHRTLLDQLQQFPMAAHDDGPDALEMAVSVAQRPRQLHACVITPGERSSSAEAGESVRQVFQRLRQDPDWGWDEPA